MPTCYFWHRGLSGGMEDEGKATFCRKFHNTRHLSEVPEETRDRYDVIFFTKCIQTPEDGDVEALVHLLTVGTVADESTHWCVSSDGSEDIHRHERNHITMQKDSSPHVF